MSSQLALAAITIYTNVLTLEYMTTDAPYTAVIAGSRGRIQLRDLVWISDDAELLEIYYREACAVLMGAYHCCLSTPGKVTLLEPHQPGHDVR